MTDEQEATIRDIREQSTFNEMDEGGHRQLVFISQDEAAGLIKLIDAQEAELQALHKREAEMQGAVRMYREANSDLWIATGDHQKVVARRCDLLLRSITNLAIKLFPPLKEVTK